MWERVLGLTEFLPEGLQEIIQSFGNLSTNGVKNVYQFTCNASWILFTTSMILFAPLIFETEVTQCKQIKESIKRKLS